MKRFLFIWYYFSQEACFVIIILRNERGILVCCCCINLFNQVLIYSCVVVTGTPVNKLSLDFLWPKLNKTKNILGRMNTALIILFCGKFSLYWDNRNDLKNRMPKLSVNKPLCLDMGKFSVVRLLFKLSNPSVVVFHFLFIFPPFIWLWHSEQWYITVKG